MAPALEHSFKRTRLCKINASDFVDFSPDLSFRPVLLVRAEQRQNKIPIGEQQPDGRTLVLQIVELLHQTNIASAIMVTRH